MNIFVLDKCPKISAEMACDKHVVKMILETAQMLSTIAVSLGHKEDLLYKPVHAKHPCTLWVGKSKQNWDWLITHGLSLCSEYTKRYSKIHKSQKIIELAKKLDVNLPNIGLTPFAQAMPIQYKKHSAVDAYRAYYIGEKRFAKWKFTEAPNWWN